MRDSAAVKWQFWLLWVLASAAGGAVVAAVARAAANAVGRAVGHALGGVVGEAAVGVVALGGMMTAIGIAQWLVLQRRISWAGWWVLASVVGGAVGGAVTLGVWSVLTVFAGETVRAFVGVIIGFAVFGIAQWLVLRRQVSRAGWLALASTVALAASPLGVVAIGALVGGEVARGAGFGAVYGAITGSAFVILSGSRATSTSVAQQSTT